MSPTLDPARTWVFAVGLVEYRHPELPGWSQRGRADAALIELFRWRGVPNDRIIFLRDRDATLVRIRTNFDRLLTRAKPGDLLFFYFSGHGGKGTFLPYDASPDGTAGLWPIDEILTRIDSFFGGDHVILAADTCYSGSVATALKARTRRSKSYTVVTSASSNETSTGAWTFTHCLMQGLRGDSLADMDADGRITMEEVGRYAAAEMKSSHRQKATYATFGRPSEGLVLASDEPIDEPIEVDVEVEWFGAWYPAEVLATDGTRSRIRYVGWGDEWIEWVGPERIRRVRPGSQPGMLQASLTGVLRAELTLAEPAQTAEVAEPTDEPPRLDPTWLSQRLAVPPLASPRRIAP